MNENKGNILITGSSGLLGSALRAHLQRQGHRIYGLQRVNRPGQASGEFSYVQSQRRMQLSAAVPLQAVINLAGSNMSDGRWTAARKQQILESRTHTTEDLCTALLELPQPPRVLLSASAMGYYGHTEARTADEDDTAGTDFLADVARQWEAATRAAEQHGIRTVHMRFGLILSMSGGVLPRFVMPLRLAASGRIGKGRQYMSWISLADTLAVIDSLLGAEHFSGPLNVVSGTPVTNDVFTRTLARVLSRPRLPPVPATLLRVLFGEMADAALLASNRVVSSRLETVPVTIRHSDLESALRDALAR